MATETQKPLITYVENGKAQSPRCCGNCCDDSSQFTNGSLVPVSPAKFQMCTNVGSKTCRSNWSKHRLSSTDSGLVLDPIAECCCHQDGISTFSENDFSNFRKSSTVIMQLPSNESDNNGQWQAQRQCCFHGRANLQQERGSMQTGNQCQCSQNSVRSIPTNYSATSLTAASPQKYQRTRSKSESCTRSESTDFSRRSDAFLIHNGQPPQDMQFVTMTSDDDCEKANRRRRKARCAKLLQWFFIVIVLGGISATVTLYILQNSRMKELENKIIALEMHQNAESSEPRTSLSRSSIITQGGDDVRPHAHLILKHEENIALTRWNQHILEWTPHIVEGKNSLKYDEKNRCLVVQEPGIYFVYNQIYVHRHIQSPSGNGMKGLSNHTMFHTIFNKPFNFPSDRTPMVVSESALSHCWNENAATQVHTSYQGIVVKLQMNDQLLVALDDFNDHMDKLDPKATFFGAFKI